MRRTNTWTFFFLYMTLHSACMYLYFGLGIFAEFLGIFLEFFSWTLLKILLVQDNSGF